MAFSKKIDAEIEALTEDWVGITQSDDPICYQAWLRWRHDELGCHIEPKAFTVPSEMPPVTQAAAKEYIATLRQIRKLIGWNTTSAKLPKDPKAWMG